MNIFQTLCYIEIETVSSCTRKCSWCLFGAYPDHRPSQTQYLDIEVIHNVFRTLKRNNFKGMIALFSINEPLLDERISSGRLIRDCKRIFDDQVLVSLTTNGDLLSPAAVEILFRNGLDQLKMGLLLLASARDVGRPSRTAPQRSRYVWGHGEAQGEVHVPGMLLKST